MTKQRKFTSLIFVIVSLSILLLSLWKIGISAEFIPWVMVLLASLSATLMFAAILLSDKRGKKYVILNAIAFLNIIFFFLYYHFPAFLKEFYPFTLWSTATVVLYGLQSAIERKNSKYIMLGRAVNYGMIFLLLPVLILKIENEWIWHSINLISALVLLTDLVLYLVPGKRQKV
jgi:hypothetical protein